MQEALVNKPSSYVCSAVHPIDHATTQRRELSQSAAQCTVRAVWRTMESSCVAILLPRWPSVQTARASGLKIGSRTPSITLINNSRGYFKARTLASAILEPYHVEAASGFECYGQGTLVCNVSMVILSRFHDWQTHRAATAALGKSQATG